MNPRQFDTEFYPTPREVARQMISFSGHYEELDKLSILDPSAGSGALLEAAKDSMRWGSDGGVVNLYAIERNPEHIAMLQGKGYQVIGHDFLEWAPTLSIDLILMNPPFSDSADHLLHAWHVMRDGVIVSLLNSESYNRNQNSKWQEIRRLVNSHGESKELGRVFAKSARQTDVEIVMVKLTKKQKTSFGFEAPNGTDGNGSGLGEDFIGKSTVAKRDVLGNMEHYHILAQKASLKLFEALREMDWAANALLGKKEEEYGRKSDPAMKWIGRLFDRGTHFDSWSHRHNFVSKEITKEAWLRVVKETGFERYFTSKVQQDFNAFIEKQVHLPFTVENVLQMIGQVVGNREKIMEDALTDVFDKLTSFDAKNKAASDLHKKYWKTNRGHMVAKRIIIPRVASTSAWLYHGHGSNVETVKDLDKVLSWLTGRQFTPMEMAARAKEMQEGDPPLVLDINTALVHYRSLGKTAFYDYHDSEFFRIRVFQKGTVHLTFRDPKVWQDFNIAAAKAKRWLGAESSGK